MLNLFLECWFCCCFYTSIQIITGLVLATFYNPIITEAFNSVENISRNIFGGWLIKAVHANAAAFFFIVIYIHIYKNILYKSYQKNTKSLWLSGLVILLLLVLTAFLGMFYLGIKCLTGQL